MAEINGSVTMSDLCIGSEPDYVFQFKLGKMNNSQAEATSSQKLKTKPNCKRLLWL